MFHRCRRHRNGGEGLLMLLILGIVLMPITGFGLLVFGETDKERGIGIALIVVSIIVGVLIKG